MVPAHYLGFLCTCISINGGRGLRNSAAKERIIIPHFRPIIAIMPFSNWFPVDMSSTLYLETFLEGLSAVQLGSDSLAVPPSNILLWLKARSWNERNDSTGLASNS